MKILIVDDEDLARERLGRLVTDLKTYEVVGEAVNGIDALQKIEKLNPEIVLLDIRMPGMDGLEVARHLVGKEDAPAVIFTTAYDEYALEAFKVNAVDYLMKPIKAESLAAALAKVAAQKIKSKDVETAEHIESRKAQLRKLHVNPDGSPKARTYLSSRTRQGITLVPLDDIFFLRSEQKYVRVYYKGGAVLLEDSLKELEREFPDRFLRIHRNCIVSIASIDRIEKVGPQAYCLHLKGVEEALEISRRHLSLVRERMRL